MQPLNFLEGTIAPESLTGGDRSPIPYWRDRMGAKR